MAWLGRPAHHPRGDHRLLQAGPAANGRRGQDRAVPAFLSCRGCFIGRAGGSCSRRDRQRHDLHVARMHADAHLPAVLAGRGPQLTRAGFFSDRLHLQPRADHRIDIFPPIDAGSWYRMPSARVPKEIELLRIQNDPYFIARGAADQPVLVSAKPFEVRQKPFPIESLMARVQQGNPDHAVVESKVLSDYDLYYHAGERRPPLPVLRVKFADPDATWFYVDPRLGQVVARFTRRAIYPSSERATPRNIVIILAFRDRSPLA